MGRMPRFLAAAAVAAALALAGCGSGGDEETPVACLGGTGAYLEALGDAPEAVELSGAVPISDCLIENQHAGDLGTIGTSMVGAATKLNAEARRDLGGQANLELGYLVGAATAGAEDTQGIHSELIRRLAVAARYSPDNQPLPAVFLATYKKGYDAGSARG
jgi:hypothetical protein